MMPTITSTTATTIASEGRTGGAADRDGPGRREDLRDGREDSIGCVGRGPRPGRPLSLAVAARDYIWLYDLRHGIDDIKIADRDGVPVRLVRRGIER